MKCSSAIVLAVAQVSTVLSIAVADSNIEDVAVCGKLGVMKWDGPLPEGVNRNNIRKCADHPLGIQQLKSKNSRSAVPSIAKAQACWYGSPSGSTMENGAGLRWKMGLVRGSDVIRLETATPVKHAAEAIAGPVAATVISTHQALLHRTFAPMLASFSCCLLF
ncbi:predicted protein [Uncinocarpus reesii 1704]|uniref:Uncharacterized protein n=1 Tax=Uncinocarpus reesii (strain UAMH 1704) TaxID=336963 RepID=C4JK58_UNCRE|nr:uncharacterized protein UREG_02015 [Uncinocarpus reesii 1704]EEP77166.1 predicted protein [Uncinocarpus reesii 1704]